MQPMLDKREKKSEKTFSASWSIIEVSENAI
jgi:hypothetical protein